MTKREAEALAADARTVFNTLGITYERLNVYEVYTNLWRIEVKRRHGQDFSHYGIRNQADLDFFAKKWAT